jgi:hypothetical protein
MLVDQAQRFQPIRGAPDDAQFGPGQRQLSVQVVEQVGFVVGDQGAGMVDGGTVCKGSSRREVRPLGWFSINCS